MLGPNITELRSWDKRLLRRYRPRYYAIETRCFLCARGPCDLSEKRGKCGQTLETYLARRALILGVTGASAHASHARDALEEAIRHLGKDYPINLGEWVGIKMPITEVVTGLRPERIEELLPVMDYIDAQIVRLLASTHFGGESDVIDLESKLLHAGTMDILSMEIADTIQILRHGFPVGSAEDRFVRVDRGYRTQRPLILCIGHNSIVAQRIIEKVSSMGLDDAIDIVGLCCTAHDMVRGKGGVIAGNMIDQVHFIKGSKPDVIVIDQQCIRLDLRDITEGFLISTSDLCISGFKNMTDAPLESIIDYARKGNERQFFISDCKKAADVAIILSQIKSVSPHLELRKDGLKGDLRPGRGPVDDYEIKGTGPSVILGEIPGIVAFVGCPSYLHSRDSINRMIELLLERGYIVITSGCAAIDIALGGLFKRFRDIFDSGGLINTGSCVSSSHIIGALIKISSIFLQRKLDRNYIEIADYILNRVGAVIVMWGAITPKAFAASTGANRLGIPVIMGPQGKKFGRTLEGYREVGVVRDERSGKEVNILTPHELFTVAEAIEELFVKAVKLCMRPNDTTSGRRRKLENYIELSNLLSGFMPDDIVDYVRVIEDIPVTYREAIQPSLEKMGWIPSFIPEPTILDTEN